MRRIRTGHGHDTDGIEADVGVEWVDLVPATDAELLDDATRDRRWPYIAAAVVLVGATAAGLVTRSSDRASPTSPVAPAPSPASAAAPIPFVTGTVSVGHPLLAVPDSWQLYARGDGQVVRVQLARGVMTYTAVPALASSGPVSFVAGTDRVMIRPLDAVTGYQVVDGHPAQPLPSSLDRGPMLPASDTGHVWVPDGASSMRVVGIDGTPTGTTVSLPPGGVPETDGSGRPLSITPTGAYVAGPTGARLVTIGTLLAVGATSFLTADCGVEQGCSTSLVDKATGRSAVVIHGDNQWTPDSGVISPDSSTAALLERDSNGVSVLRLVDLSTDRVEAVQLSVELGSRYGSDIMAWSPDGEYLFVVDATGSLFAVSRATGDFLDLGAEGTFSQLAFRG